MSSMPLDLSAELLAGLLAGLAVVIVALWRGWLTVGGAAAALAVGGLTLGLGGGPFVVPLLTFFVASSLLSKVRNDAKKAAERHFDKSHTRDAVQVLANGGVGALAALGFGLTQDPRWFAFFVGVMAAVTADTWATELGTLSKSPPRAITTGKVIAPGMSGGISLLGLVASVAGGMLIGGAASFAGGGSAGWLLLIGGASGLGGSLIDSVLGATLQRHFWDPVAEALTEKSVVDGEPLQLKRGLVWINNDVVNLLAALGGGLVGLLFGY